MSADLTDRSVPTRSTAAGAARFTPEALAAARAARRANIDATRRTTRPGSEHTDLKVGDAVIAHRSEPSAAVWRRSVGRRGWVATINAQEVENGWKYVEISVSWMLREDVADMRADTWFRADELEVVS